MSKQNKSPKKDTQNVRSLRKRMPTTPLKSKLPTSPPLCELRARPKKNPKPEFSSSKTLSKASLSANSSHTASNVSNLNVGHVHSEPQQKSHDLVKYFKGIEKVWVYSEKDQVFLPCTVNVTPKRNSQSSLLLIPFQSRYPISISSSSPPKVLPYDPSNLEEHQALCYKFLSLPKFKKSKKLKEEMTAILNQSVSNTSVEREEEDTSSLTSLDSDSFADSISLIELFTTSNETHDEPTGPVPIEPITTLSQDTLSSDDETFMSPNTILKEGQSLLAYLSSEKKYAPAKLLQIRKTFFLVGFFNGTEQKLKRKEIKVPSDADFAQVPFIELPHPTINPNYSNDPLQQCMESIYPILDKIMLGEYPSWRYKKFITSTASNAFWTLGRKRGGNPYSNNEYAFILRLLIKRYGKNLTPNISSDLPLPSTDIESTIHDLDHEVKNTMRLIDLVIVPECMLRLLLVSHLLLNDHESSPELYDFNTIVSNSYHRLGHWEKNRFSSEKNYLYTLTLEEETPEIMEKAEYLLNNSNWAQAILTLRKSMT